MPIGKDSITKRVAKVDVIQAEAKTKEITPENDNQPVKKTTKSSSTKKDTTTKAVMTNIAPETVEAVIGHKENSNFIKIGIGSPLPFYLL